MIQNPPPEYGQPCPALVGEENIEKGGGRKLHRLQNGNISNLEGRKTSVPLPLPTGRILHLKRYSLQIQKNGERDLVVWTRNWIQKCSGWAVRGEKPLPRGPECLPRGRCSPAMGGSPGNLENHLDQNYIKLSHTKDKRKYIQSSNILKLYLKITNIFQGLCSNMGTIRMFSTGISI